LANVLYAIPSNNLHFTSISVIDCQFAGKTGQ
jgi:hypothetical protein